MPEINFAAEPVEQLIGQGHELKSGIINQSGPGTVVLETPAPGLRIYIVSYLVVLNGDGSFTFDGLTGAIPAVEGSGAGLAGQPSSPLFWTAPGAALSLTTIGGAARGHYTYLEEQ